MSESTVAVLGGDGYIGAAVVSRLSEEGAFEGRIRRVTRRSPTSEAGDHVGSDATLDLTDADAVGRCIADADIVVIAVLYAPNGSWRDADSDPRASSEVNVGVVQSVVTACERSARVPLVLLPGTTSVSDGTVDTWSVYERQKARAEEILLGATRRGYVRGVSLRLPTVYGAYDAESSTGRGIVATVAKSAVAGVSPSVWGDGSATRDLLHIRDVAEAVYTSIRHPDELIGRHWELGTGSPATVASLFTEIAQAVANRTGLPPMSIVHVQPPDDTTTTDLQSHTADPRAFARVTGWSASIDIHRGLASTVDHLLKQSVPVDQSTEAAASTKGQRQ